MKDVNFVNSNRSGAPCLVFPFSDAIINSVEVAERKNVYMFKNSKSIILVTFLVLLVATPLISAEKPSKFAVSRKMMIAGAEIKAGTYNVTYVTNSPEATVQFLKENGDVVLEVKGRVEEGDKPSDHNALAIGKDASGKEAIKRMLFRDKTTTIVFE